MCKCRERERHKEIQEREIRETLSVVHIGSIHILCNHIGGRVGVRAQLITMIKNGDVRCR